ncbi:hypothetical protein MVEN_00151100 [Mycena venus]|uniref:Arrestin-like N-terminal domain-containing protein n=1 Tax=Mycena venus TaxID=2733690 RepID=A0A8H6Z0R4_9AGAR|nr:hypothetical protein MVEN_00151100 [Mycena venus]
MGRTSALFLRNTPLIQCCTESAMEPPSYPSHEGELPAYTRRPTPPPTAAVLASEPREFTYEIKARGSSTPWAILLVQGDPRLSKGGPTITQGSNLAGSVKLALRSAEAIQAVCILIRGEILKGERVAITFLDSKHTLWPSDGGDNTGKSAGKLKGDYEWPFSLFLPSSINKDGETYHLPHTFSDPGSFNVRYAVELRIVRGKLRPDDKLTCTIGYFTMKQPGPPSRLRQLAYQENSPLFGPEADPDGWHSQSLSVKGTLFSSRTIDVKVTFSVANPLAYTRSASIPCAMTIETPDTEALDLLSTPAAAMVYLERAFRENKNTGGNTVEPCARAVFWLSTEGQPEAEDVSSRRRLMGEIHLKGNLHPSSAMVGFRVEYNVVVFPFHAAGFKPLEESSGPIFRLPVEIMTRYAAGPRQRTYSTPTYETRNASTSIDHYYSGLAVRDRTVRDGML